MLEAERIMKRCQIGTRNYEEANNLHAECYRIIGELLAEREACAKMVDHILKEDGGTWGDAIRARGKA